MRDATRRFIAVVSRLAPGAARREFRAEWEAELAIDPSFGRALGAVPDAWYLFRQQWSLDMMLQDIRYAARLLGRRPAYTAVVLLTLAIGIGATTAMFSVINGVLIRPLPYPDAGRLVAVWENDRLNRKPRYPVAPANYVDWRTGSRTFAHLAAWAGGGAPLGTGAETFHANVVVATTNFFDTLAVPPLIGRTFAAAEGVPPRHRVLVLSYSTWQHRFGGDPGVVGRTVQFAEVPYQIIGVMPRGFAFPERDADAWRPMVETPAFAQQRAQHFLSVVGRVRPSATLDEARRDLEAIAAGARQAHPDTNEQRGTTQASLADAIAGDAREPMLLLFAAVGLLLLIAIVNVANLMLVESASRRREMALRSALGADRLRIVRQLLVEGVLLSLCGGAAGLALAVTGTRALARIAADYVPRIQDVSLDTRVLAFAAALSIVAGVCFALAPALAACRADVQHDLRDAGRGTVGRGRYLRGVLVFVELAAAVILVIGAGLVLKSFWRVTSVSPGFATAGVLAADVELSRRYDKGALINQFYTADLLPRVLALPGVAGAGVVNNLPVGGSAWTAWLTIENAPRPAGEPPEVGYRTASSGYFAAMQIPVLEGRGIADGDTADAEKVVVVNRVLADRFFPGGRAVGSRIRIGPNPKAPWRSIVGVVGNVRHVGPEAEPTPELFLPTLQDVNGDMTLVVRTAGDPDALVPAVREAVRAADPSVTLYRVRTIADVMSEHLAPRRLSMVLVGGFAALALGLALLGIYGVMSYTVTERVPEIGVRLALGADPAGIRRMIVGDGLRLTAPALAVGVASAFAATRLAQSLLFDVSPTDPATFVTVAVAVGIVAVLACYLPARRASRVDPLKAIRAE
jgi:putative ABC transport system permease protein